MWLLGLHSGKLTPAVVKSDMNVLVQEVRKGQGEKIDVQAIAVMWMSKDASLDEDGKKQKVSKDIKDVKVTSHGRSTGYGGW